MPVDDRPVRLGQRAAAGSSGRAYDVPVNGAGEKTVVTNRRARHEYHVEERFEAGLALEGTEVKSLRAGHASLGEAYGVVRAGEICLVGASIEPYAQGNRANHDVRRDRRLLLRKPEIARIQKRVDERGYTLVPLRLYFRDGRAKLELALARGKDFIDKRATLADRDARREIERALKRASGMSAPAPRASPAPVATAGRADRAASARARGARGSSRSPRSPWRSSASSRASRPACAPVRSSSTRSCPARRRTSRPAATLALSVMLLILAGGLRRRKHRAWQLSVVALAGVALFHVAKGLDLEESALSIALLGALIVCRSSFDIEGDPETPYTFLRHALAALAGLVLLGVLLIETQSMLVGRLAAARAGARRPRPLGHRPRGGPPDRPRRARRARCSPRLRDRRRRLAACCSGCRPRAQYVRQHARDRADAMRLVREHGSDSLDYFALRRDKDYFFSAEPRPRSSRTASPRASR